MVLPEVKQSPAKAVVAMPINKPLTSVPSDMSCKCALYSYASRKTCLSEIIFFGCWTLWRTSNLPRCLSMDSAHSMCCNLIFFLHPCCFNQALTAKLCECYLWIVQNLSYSISKEAVLYLDNSPLFSQEWLPLALWFGPWCHLSFFQQTIQNQFFSLGKYCLSIIDTDSKPCEIDMVYFCNHFEWGGHHIR